MNKEKIDVNVIIKSNERGNYLVNRKGEIVVDCRAKYCKECGNLIEKADDWKIICYLNLIINKLLKEIKEL